MPNEDLTTRLAAQAHGVDVQPRGRTVADMLRDDRQKAEIAKALPRHMTTERFARLALNELRRNERLQACSPASLLGALMQAAQLGLEPGPLGQVYLVPFGSEVTFIIGYRGYIDLYRRSGEGGTIVAREVRENDAFSFEVTGPADALCHVPMLRGDRGPVYAYYAIARLRDGTQIVHVMTDDEVQKHRERSRAKNSGPWVTDPEAMGRKTVIRAMSPYLPVSAEIGLALESDENVYTWYGGAEPRPTISLPAAGDPAPAPPQQSAAGSPSVAEESSSPSVEVEAAPSPSATAAYDPLEGWDDEEMATLAHTEMRDRIQRLASGAQDRLRTMMPHWPMNAADYSDVELMLEAEEELADLPEAPLPDAGAEVVPPGDGDGAIGPSAPAIPQADRPLEDWPVDWLKAELDRLGVDADRRSRQAMIDAIANHRIATDPDLFGDEPF